MDAEPREIIEQKRYELGNDAIVIVNATWSLVVECCNQRRDSETPQMWTAIQGVEVTGPIQMFMEQHEGEVRGAEFIGAQLSSDTSLTFARDGTILRMESIRDE